ncbi:hypothetical protein D3C71_1313080 [compost metagenome]
MKPIYTGIFFDEKAYNEMNRQSSTNTLDKRIENPHITLEFKPKSLLPDELIGLEVEVTIIGEGNDGMNHGYEVIVPDALKEHYHGSLAPHITMSIDYVAKPINTGSIDFENRKSFSVFGKVGYFTTEGVIFNKI